MKKIFILPSFIFLLLQVMPAYAQPGGDPSGDPDAGLTTEAIEYEALKAFYESTGGDSWTNSSNWLQGTTAEDIATWHGIMMQEGDVYMIDLKQNNLQGPLPEELGDSKGLTYLNFYWNSINALPSAIGSLSNIFSLVIERNQLASLPDSIGNLTNITSLSVHDNLLTSLPESIGQMTNLDILYVDNNKLAFLIVSVT